MVRARTRRPRRVVERRWSLVFGLVLLVLVAAACGDGPQGGSLLPVERGSRVDEVRLDVVVDEEGRALMTVAATFAGGRRTAFPAPAAARSIDDPADTGNRTTAGFALADVAEADSDITVIEVPTYRSPPDATRQDPVVRVSGTVTLPDGAGSGIEVVWTNGLHADVVVEGDTIRFDGENPAWTDAELLIGGPPGMLTGVAPGSRSGRVAFDAEVRRSEAQTAALESTLDSQLEQERLIGWVIVGVGIGVSTLMLIQLVRVNTADSRARRRLAKTFPTYVVEPPDDLSPALVDLVDADGRRVEAEAAAGTLLHLAHRRIVEIDGYADGRFVLRIPTGGPLPAGLTGSERTLLEGLRSAHPSGEVTGPPVWPSGRPSWWGHYRREVLKEGRAAGVVQRRIRLLYFGPFIAGIVTATWPWWAADRIWLVPTLCIAFGVVAFVPLRGGLVTTHRGFTAACRWRAFARYVRDHGELGDLGPAAVHVWGPYLAYSVVLGEAPTAAEALAPQGVPERTTRAERRELHEDHAADADQTVGPLTPPLEPTGGPPTG